MPLKLVLDTGPTSPPVTVAEAKAHCRIDLNDDDALIESLIYEATDYVQTRTRRQLVEATYVLYLDAFPAGEIVLPRSPLAAVGSVKYYNSANVLTTLTATTDYDVDIQREPGTVFLPFGKSWPTTYDRPNAVEITFDAAQDTLEGGVSHALKQAVKMYVAARYANRGDGAFDSKVLAGVDAICRLYEVPIVA